MSFIVMIFGVLQIIGGVLVTLVAKSAIHEILGAVSFGLGVLAIGLAKVIMLLSDIPDIKRAAYEQTGLLKEIVTPPSEKQS